MNISLPESFRSWLEEQAERAKQSVDEYVQRLIEDAKERLYWEWAEAKVSEALDGAPAAPMTPEEWQRLKRRITERFPETTGEGGR